MPFKAIELAVHLADIEHFNLVITTACQEPVAVDWVPPNLVNGCIVRMYLVYTSSTLPRIPDLDVLILAARQNQ